MFINIHSHHLVHSDSKTIVNLTLDEAENVFQTDNPHNYSLGIHPWFINEKWESEFAKLSKWALENRLVAIGECGLDKNISTPSALQMEIFEKHIVLSEQVKLPLIIHCVGCFNELLALRKKFNPQQSWIIHGFRAKPELAKMLLNAGCALSFGTHYNTDSIIITPLNKLFIETDEADINIEELYSKIAKIKQCNVSELSAGEMLFNNIKTQNGKQE